MSTLLASCSTTILLNGFSGQMVQALHGVAAGGSFVPHVVHLSNGTSAVSFRDCH